METEAKPSIVLAYSSPVAREVWLRRVPAWVIALLLVVPVLAFERTGLWRTQSAGSLTAKVTYPLLYPVALFIPGALRRLKWRHIFAMFCLGSLASGLELTHTVNTLEEAAPWQWAVPSRDLVLIMLIGVAEWIMVRPRSWLALAGAALGGMAAAAVLTIEWQVISAILGISFTGMKLADAVHAPFRAVISWIAIPMGLAITPRASRRRWIATGAAVLASIGGFALFTQVVVYDLARRSVVRGGPFDPDAACRLLHSRTSSDDIDALWRGVEDAAGSGSLDADYAFLLLNRSDPNFTARMADLLQRKPSLALAEQSAWYLGRRHEVMPILLRYAFSGPRRSLRCVSYTGLPYEAIEDMKTACESDCTDPLAADFALSSESWSYMFRAFEGDPGRTYSRAVAAWDAAIRKLNMPPEVTDECIRISHAYTSYWHASARLQCARRQVAEASAGSGMRGMRGLADVRPADLNVPGTDALEREVQRYVREVNAAIQPPGPIDDR